MGRGSSKSKSIANIKFWIAIGTGKQLAFRDDGSRYEIDVDIPVGDQHILVGEVMACGQSRVNIKTKLKARKQKTTVTRNPSVKLCETCEKNFKKTSIWLNWTNPPVLKHEAAKIQINPQLLEVVNVEEQQTVVRAEPSQESKNVGESPKENQTGLLLPGQH